MDTAKMDEKIINQINYDNYARLLRSIHPRMVDISVFDQDGNTLWKGDNYLSSHNIDFGAVGTAVTRHHLATGETLYLCGIDTKEEIPKVVIALLMPATQSAVSTQDISINEIVTAVARSIQTEIELQFALVTTESELNAMAAELTERYEELNLIYEADNNALRGVQSQESLRQLVNNCTGYLNVGMTALIIPDKNITIYDFNDENHIQNQAGLIKNILCDCFDSMKAKKQTIVINTIQNAIQYNVFCEIPQKLIITPVLTGEEEVIGVLIIINNNWKVDFTNSDRNLLQVMAKKVSKVIHDTYDDLTGLINKHSFEFNLKDAFSQVHSQGLEHALLNIDLDRFGVINETAGNEAGDKLLRMVSRTVCNMVRSRDIVARLGGDEFGVLLESCPIQTAAVVAKNIRKEIAGLAFELEGKKYNASVCVGVVPINAESDSAATILSTSEIARNAAKERGVNQIVIYEQNDIDLLRRRDEIKWVTRIQSALRDSRFQLHSQLIKGFKRSCDDHYEILLRMIDDGGQLVFPDQFLTAAEHFHLMPELDRWIIKNTIDNLLANTDYRQSPPCKVAINLSGQSLCDEGFQNYLRKQVRRLGEYRHNLGFEITESAAIANLMQAGELIDLLKSEGCSFALDDFGTGLSSFAYLQNLHVDYLKIDGSFVRKIVEDPVAKTMVTAINQVGQAMGLQTIAEYAENDHIITELKQIGVDFGQGYGIDKPKPFQLRLEELTQHSLVTIQCEKS
jgi:diguanylate cyclase (GGDEF)-like protein